MDDQYKNCRDCIYSCKLMEDLISCDYYIKTDIRRPCPGGDGCTVKQTGKKVGAWEFQNNAEWEKRKKERNEKRNELRRLARIQEKRCVVCGEAFQTTDSRRLYCPVHATPRHKLITKICKVCGKQFETTDGRRQLCSPECVDISRKNRYKLYDLKRRPKDGAQCVS